MDKISEKTFLPISFVLGILGGVFWLSSVYIKSDSNAYEIKEIKEGMTQNEKRHSEILMDILQRVVRIEEKLNHRGNK